MKNRLVILISFLILSGVFLRCNGKLYQNITDITYDEIDENDSQENTNLEKLISPYDEALTAEMNVVIGSSEISMSKARPEGTLSNFVADLVFKETAKLPDCSPDFCLLNHGGLRAPLPEGDIKVEHIFQLMPFENEVVLVTVTGDKIAEIASYLNYSGGEPVSQIEVSLGERPEITLQRETIDPSKNYTIVTSDYLAKGGDKMYFFNDPENLQKTGIKLRDMILDHIKTLTQNEKTLNSQLDGRISSK